MSREAFKARIITMVIGGRSGRHQDAPCIFAIPRNENSSCSLSVSERGGGHPCARCQALIAERYFRMVGMDTVSNAVPSAKAGSLGSGSVTAQSMKEWRRGKAAGSLAASVTEKVSQKMWNLRRPAP